MKKRTHRIFATLLSTVMIAGIAAIPVSAEASVSGTAFPENLTYQQVCEMSEEEFLALPYAEKMVKDIHEYETSFFSYYLNFNRKPNGLEQGLLIFQKNMITRELKTTEYNGHTRKQVFYHFPEEYKDTFTSYYGTEIAEKSLVNIEVYSGDFHYPFKLTLQNDTGITLKDTYGEELDQLYTTTKFNDGLEEYDGLERANWNMDIYTPEEIEYLPVRLVYFNLKDTQSFRKTKDPLKEIQTIYDWTEGQNAIRYVYDYDILWENSIELARQYYGYFYVFGENVAIMTPEGMYAGQPYEPICGDANADGMVTITDVIYLQKSVAGLLLRSNTTDTSGDLYYDGVIDERDAEILLRYLVGLEETLPVVPET